MKTLLLVLLALVLAAPAAAAPPDTYRLRAGDTVLVMVWREEALEKEVRVLPDGSITFPLAGRVGVAGLTVPEVERRIAEKLKEYIEDPVVTAVVTGIEGNRVYVIGKVLRPGAVILSEPMTVLQALSLAGGLDKFADGNSVRVLRAGADGERWLPVRYNDLLSGRNTDTNVQLRGGDTIVVP